MEPSMEVSLSETLRDPLFVYRNVMDEQLLFTSEPLRSKVSSPPCAREITMSGCLGFRWSSCQVFVSRLCRSPAQGKLQHAGSAMRGFNPTR